MNLAKRLGNTNLSDVAFKATKDNNQKIKILKNMSTTNRIQHIIDEINKNPNKQFSVKDITKNMEPYDAVEFKKIARKL